MNRIFFLAAAICLCFNATAQLPILISECVWWKPDNTQPFTPVDSITYSYSNGRNSVVPAIGGEEWGPTLIAKTNNLNPIQAGGIYMYDSCQHHYYTANQTWDTLSRIFQVFGANGLVSTALARGYDVASSSWKNAQKIEYVYGISNTLDTSTLYNYNSTTASWDFDSRDVYFYNAGKKEIANHQYTWKTSSWNLSNTDSFWYNTTGDAFKHRSWAPGLPGTANEYRHFEFAYDAGHRLIADTQYYNPSPPYYETFQYNSNGTLASSYYYSSWNGGWQVRFKTEYHYDANNNLSGYTQYRWDMPTSSFIANGQKTYTYNSFNQVTSSNDGADWRKFYYGPAPVTVPAVRQDNDLLLYPVPATSYVNLELHTATPQNLSISITDMSGRVVKQWTENHAQHYKKFVPVMDMAPGNYTIQVSGKEPISKTFSVIR